MVPFSPASTRRQAEGYSLSERARLRIVCRGVVQGVGFRPAVHRLATSLALAGWVRNAPEGAIVEVEGNREVVHQFARQLPTVLPPLARLADYDVHEISPTGGTGFTVLVSAPGRRERALVPPDTVLCRDCRAEMEDPADRRHRYPFTTCTNCGPRFSLVRTLPYDRERTSMACFPLCPDCRREYEDPGNRRFHAEPVCCPACGPHLWLANRTSRRLASGNEAIAAAVQTLAAGEIVAVKGLGGFQLACRADDAGAVVTLRQRKHRPTKPFAVMVRDLATAHRLAVLAPADEALLTSPHGPVLLLPARPGTSLSPLIAPGLDDVGLLLPTTPLHVELFRDAPYDALVMTSGNVADEPICRGNREATTRLSGIADRFLLHDRDVVRRVDDSVFRSTPEGPVAVRRARGHVPVPLPLPVATPAAVLAMGGHLQTTACLAVGEEAYLSQHVGDLDTDGARAFLLEVVEGLEAFLEACGQLVVVDAHPDYASTLLGTRLAVQRQARLVPVQHHLAHAAAVLAEHEAFPPLDATAAAIVLDGTGWGEDGTAWGGEWLLLNGRLVVQRLASLEPFPLVGGEAAVRQPWRVAVALLHDTEPGLLTDLPLAQQVPSATLAAVRRLARQPGWPVASGAGRLFEAAGAVLGLATVNGYEGEAAARLEAAASRVWPAPPWPEVALADGNRAPHLPSRALLRAAARRAAAGEPPEVVAAGFHATFCRLAAELTARVVPPVVTAVAVGGGCLVNRLLRSELHRLLAAAGRQVLLPWHVPPGDGGVSYGQAVVGAVALARGAEPRLDGGPHVPCRADATRSSR